MIIYGNIYGSRYGKLPYILLVYITLVDMVMYILVDIVLYMVPDNY